MPTREQVFLVADKLRAKRKRVSLASVRAALPRGGSYRDISRPLAQWKLERSYQPRIELATLPDVVAGRLATATKALWEAALAAAGGQLAAEREQLAAERRIADEQMDEAVSLADAATARSELLARENARLLEELAAAEARLKKVRANEFWDRVMREIHELMPVDGASLTVADIERRLPRALVGEAEHHVEEWSRETLRKKLDQRVHWQKYFAKDGSRFRRRLAADDLAA